MTNKEIIKAIEELIETSKRIAGCTEPACMVCAERDRVKTGARLAVEALKQKYPRIIWTQPEYQTLALAARQGHWVCDSVDHNENEGCSNPTCFKYYGRTK